jgi:predicted metal-dependent phosphoesterase TrpH
MDRRRFAKTAGAAGLAGVAVVVDPLSFAYAAGGAQTRTISGRIGYGEADWVYIPVVVPQGVRQIAVSYTYDRPTPPPGALGNALDIGIFDESGYRLGDPSGFRGWSGGFRTSFAISRAEATPGYLPGPVRRGVWHVILAPYTVAPQGLAWSVEVTLTHGDPGPAAPFAPAPERAAGRGRAWYRGDMHLHTVHSDGRRLPEEVAAGARAAGLDFIVSTEHNTSSAGRIWGAHAGPDLLILNGEEITTRNGHYLALGLPPTAWIDWRYRAADGQLRRFTHDIHAAGGLAVAAHPYAPCLGCAWKFGYAGMDAIEVWNGPWTADDEAAVATWDNLLVAGADRDGWLPAVGDSDAHNDGQVIGLPQTVVLADDLHRKAIMAGVRAGRSWIAESSAVDLSLSAAAAGRTAGIGERLPVPEDAEVNVRLAVTGAPGCAVRFVTDQGQRYATLRPAEGTGEVAWATTPRNSRYVRAEVRRRQPTPTTADTMVALTNPIFLGRR